MARALAICTRCCMPPLKLAGKSSIRARGTSVRCNKVAARCLIRETLYTSAVNSFSATLPPAVKWGLIPINGFW